ncbi:MAG: alpha/beta fold hydrolase [Acidobacteriota bacterium]|nr:alpha/beta fold hydrolase [Acidobacteriota bacterium]
MLLISFGVLLSAAGAAGLLRERLPERKIVLADSCHTPARVISSPSGPTSRTAILLHGLSASAAIMEPLGQSLAIAGWRVFLLDLPGHGRSIEPFSYAQADACAAGAADYLEREDQILPAQTILVGHSLGGAVVLHLARRFPAVATIAISPAPTAMPRPIPANLLILAGQFDLGPVKKMARSLLNAARGPRIALRDFAARAAVALHFLPAQMHGSMVLGPATWRLVLGWAGRAADAGPSSSVPIEALARPLAALFAQFSLLAGLVLLVAPAESLFARVFSVESPIAQPAGPGFGWRGALGRWALASFFAVSALGLLHVSQYVHPVGLLDGDWAAYVALLTGIVLAALAKKVVSQGLRFDPRMEAFAAISAIVIVFAFGLALRPELAEVSFNAERLWRWPALVGFIWPYFLVEEAVLGPPSGWLRFFLFVGMRAIVWLAQLFALFVFWRSGLVLVLLGPGFAIASLGQRFAADALRRRGAGITSTALFDAILAAAILALVLPLT